MRWIHDYQLVLMDFDGLLVNTEEIHYLAYKQMCAARGFNLDWDFNRYCQAAHYEAHAVRDQLYAKFPELQAEEPNWSVLYAEKKQALCTLLEKGTARLMPGVDRLLTALHTAQIPRCVVTHSPNDLVSLIRNQNPLLNTIPLWITREHYSKPKPDSECYIKAVEMFSQPSDRVIGFEDTPRGITALLGTRAQAVLISQIDYPEIPEFKKKGVLHFHSFNDIVNTLHA